MMAALSITLMLLTGLIPAASMALPAVAGVLLIAVVLESGPRWALLIYAAVCLLGLLLCPQKDAVIYYAFFFGHYPILKRSIESLPSRPLQWLLKLVTVNVCGAAAAVLCVFFTGLQIPFSKGLLYLAAGWLFLNGVFVVYDICVTQLIGVYVTRLRKIFRLH